MLALNLYNARLIVCLINCSAVTNNVQCYYNNIKKTWVVENSEVDSPAGSNAIGCLVGQFIKNMQADSGCRTS